MPGRWEDDPRMDGQDIRSPEKERQILDGAAAAFGQDGYEGTSMSAIAAAAGVSKGTLYNYFDGKKELFAAFVQRECTQRLLLIFDEVDDAAPADVTLLLVCRRVMDMLLSEEALLIYRMVVAESRQFPELSEAFYVAGPRRGLECMAALIRRQTCAGQLAADDADFAAEQLFALAQTKLVAKRRMGLIAEPGEAERDRIARAAVAMFLLAYGTGPTQGRRSCQVNAASGSNIGPHKD